MPIDVSGLSSKLRIDMRHSFADGRAAGSCERVRRRKAREVTRKTELLPGW